MAFQNNKRAERAVVDRVSKKAKVVETQNEELKKRVSKLEKLVVKASASHHPAASAALLPGKGRNLRKIKSMPF